MPTTAEATADRVGSWLDRALEERSRTKKPGRDAVIPLLQSAQAEFGYLPHAAMDGIARRLRMPAAAVQGIATFYQGLKILSEKNKRAIEHMLDYGFNIYSINATGCDQVSELVNPFNTRMYPSGHYGFGTASAAALEKYLGSGMIKGVGPITAKKIVKHFGDGALEIFEKAIARAEVLVKGKITSDDQNRLVYEYLDKAVLQ